MAKMKKGTKRGKETLFLVVTLLSAFLIIVAAGFVSNLKSLRFSPATQCSDGIDNDNDGFCDFNSAVTCPGFSSDPDCYSAEDNTEQVLNFSVGPGDGQDSYATLYENGNYALSVYCFASDYDCNPNTNSAFVVRDESGNNVSYIDETGMCISIGDVNQFCPTIVGNCENPSDPAFEIKNGAGNTVSYIDQKGRFCVSGTGSRAAPVAYFDIG